MRKGLKPLIQTLVVSLLPLAAWAGPVNINTADAETLAAELTGIGMAKAEAIVADRERNGNFKSASDLTRVKGVGERTIAMNKGNIRIVDPN